MRFKQLSKTTSIEYKNQETNQQIVLEEIPVIEDCNQSEELIDLDDLFKAEQNRIAKEKNVTPKNLLEIMILFAPSIPKNQPHIQEKPQYGIKQKFRFNKMVFYIEKKIQELYGVRALEYHQIASARAGPVPFELTQGLKDLEQRHFIKIYNEWNGKKVFKGQSNWEELNRTRAGACVAVLTDDGIEMARSIWADMAQIFGTELTDILCDMAIVLEEIANNPE